ncbi:MAG TPA: PEP-CTERM sorting domain-containing protein [Burkholderiales bacterium]|nr:PEP-CTERM sorting domain-containing protein [Burkholderiales bacterium]
MNKKLGLRAAGVAVILAAGMTHAAPLQWTLENAVFDDQTSATGSFVYDADTNTYSDWNVSVQPGTLGAFIYDTGNSQLTASNMDSTGVLFLAGGNSRYVNFNFVSDLTDAGGSIPLELGIVPGTFHGSYECDNCVTIRAFVTGAVTASAASVPEPEALALLGLSALGFGLVRSSRRIRAMHRT